MILLIDVEILLISFPRLDDPFKALRVTMERSFVDWQVAILIKSV